MKFGAIVRLIRPMEKEFVVFEVGDELYVANYIHKHYVLLKHPQIRDLQRVEYKDMEYTFAVVGQLLMIDSFKLIEPPKGGFVEFILLRRRNGM